MVQLIPDEFDLVQSLLHTHFIILDGLVLSLYFHWTNLLDVIENLITILLYVGIHLPVYVVIDGSQLGKDVTNLYVVVWMLYVKIYIYTIPEHQVDEIIRADILIEELVESIILEQIGFPLLE